MDNRMDINSVLADIRSLRSQMQRPDMARQEAQRSDGIRPDALRPDSLRTDRTQATEAPGFGEMLKQAVNSVAEVQSQAGDLREAYVAGEPNVDLAQVMIAAEKSSVAFTALTQVRNKVVQAYEEIMKMPV